MMEAVFGNSTDIDSWMQLVRKVSWNFPGLETEASINEHEQTVLKFMNKKQALCVRNGETVAGVLLFSRGRNMICCLAVEPEQRRHGIASMLLEKALDELDRSREITVSTFRENDDKGIAPRALYRKYGFREGEMTVEFGYPNQVFVLYPIREVLREDIPVCVNLIKQSFKTVADEFGFTEENAPGFTAFATNEERLLFQMDEEHRPMYVYEEAGVLCGYYSLLMQDNNECELNNLAVLPEYRHKGIGKRLMEHACSVARDNDRRLMNIGIVEENVKLRKWYEENGAVHLGTHKFDFFPFTCGYMRKEL